MTVVNSRKPLLTEPFTEGRVESSVPTPPKGRVRVAFITIIDDEVRCLYFHAESKVVHHKIRSAIRGKDFRDLLSRGAECMEKNHAVKWLSDDRDSVVIAPEDNAWGDVVWAPRVVKAGFKYWAIVVPTDAVGSMQMRRLATEYRKRGVTVEVFSDLDTALGWLESLA